MKNIFDFAIRLLGFIPFAILSLIAALALWIKYMVNYSMYGGEAIAYTQKNTRKTIQDVFFEVKKITVDKK